MTDIPLEAEVFCTEGAVGTSTAVVIDPVNQNVTHVVVQIDKYDEHMVPVELITASDHDTIKLNCSKKELDELPLFKEFEYVAGVPNYPDFQGGEWEPAYLTLDYEQEMTLVEKVPPGELAVHRGDPVKATDGQVGVAGEFIVESESGHITHFLLQKGHLWGKREVTLGLDLIDKVENGVVYLKIDKDAVERLPAVKVKHHFLRH